MHDVSLGPNLTVQLLPGRALFWAEEATLFVADLHLGKADTFQASGIPIPAAVTQSDLARLSALLLATSAQRLVILGDFFHAASSQSSGVVAQLGTWRAVHASVEMLLVTGNHDLHAGPPPVQLDIRACGLQTTIGPFRCIHAPAAEPAYYTLCGHTHPAAMLSERAGNRSGSHSARLPCFHVGQRQMILPAFSHFTGGKAVACRPGDRIFVTTGEQVFEAALR